MLRSKLVAILGVVVLVTVASILAFMTRGETLYDCTFRLTSNKDVYTLGDVIILTVEILPRKARRLTLSENPYRNIVIWNMQEGKGELHNQGKPVRYELAPDKPLRFKINGSIVQRQDGSVWVDFGDFGKGMIKGERFPELRFSLLPYKIPPLDSVEWGASNKLQLALESKG